MLLRRAGGLRSLGECLGGSAWKRSEAFTASSTQAPRLVLALKPFLDWRIACHLERLRMRSGFIFNSGSLALPLCSHFMSGSKQDPGVTRRILPGNLCRLVTEFVKGVPHFPIRAGVARLSLHRGSSCPPASFQ